MRREITYRGRFTLLHLSRLIRQAHKLPSRGDFGLGNWGNSIMLIHHSALCHIIARWNVNVTSLLSPLLLII